jgi:competence protein ComEA
MAVITVMTVALMMTWVVPELAEELKKVNINTTSVDELMTLEGVGQKVAQNIIRYSQTNGPFQYPDDLMKVRGVGPRLFDANQAHIMVHEID